MGKLAKRTCKKMHSIEQMEKPSEQNESGESVCSQTAGEFVFTQLGIEALKEESEEHYLKVGSPSLGDFLTPEIESVLAQDDVTVEILLEMGFIKPHRQKNKTVRMCAKEASIREFTRQSS